MNIQLLIDYDTWANARIYNSFKKLPESEIKNEITKLFSHLLAAQIVWLSRINNDTPSLDIWPILTFSEIEKLLAKNPAQLKALIPRKNENIHYSNSKGERFLNSIDEILTHLTIHGQHHRAQIAALLRRAGATPPGTDFIFFLRTLDN